MIWGFPGGTERAQTSYGVQFKMDYYYPPIIEVFGEQLAIWKDHMDEDKRLKSNMLLIMRKLPIQLEISYWSGKGVSDLDVVGEKQALKKNLQNG